MRFNLKKIPIHLGDQFHPYSWDLIQANQVLLVPLYTKLQKNKKFVALKRPYDFYSEEELKKNSHRFEIYVPNIYDSTAYFVSVGRSFSKILAWDKEENQILEPASYERSEKILEQLGGLWAPLVQSESEEFCVENYFISVLISQFIKPIVGQYLFEAREKDWDRYELSLIRAYGVIWIGLHLGYTDLDILNHWFFKFFQMETGTLPGIIKTFTPEQTEINEWVRVNFNSVDVKLFSSSLFENKTDRISSKLRSRIRHAATRFIESGATLKTIQETPWLLESGGEDAA